MLESDKPVQVLKPPFTRVTLCCVAEPISSHVKWREQYPLPRAVGKRVHVRLLAKDLAQSKHSMNVHRAGKLLPLKAPMKEVDSSIETFRYYALIPFVPSFPGLHSSLPLSWREC